MLGVSDPDLSGSTTPDGMSRSFPWDWRRIAARAPWLAIAMTLLAMNLSTAVPSPGLDPSWQLALNATSGLVPGREIVFPYGPLGFLAAGTRVARVGFVATIVYQAVVLLGLFAGLSQLLRARAVRRGVIVACLTSLAIGIGTTELIVPELAIVAGAVWLLVLAPDRFGGCRGRSPHAAVFAVAGGLAAIQLMVKFSTGLVLGAVVAALALSWGRWRPLATSAVSAVLVLVASWVVMGHPLSAIPTWIVRSIDVAIGYTAMTDVPEPARRNVDILFFGLTAAVLLAGVVRSVLRDRRRALVPALAVGLVAWFAVKQGFVRWDDFHAANAYAMAAVLILCVPWDRQVVVGLPAISALLAVVLVTIGQPAPLSVADVGRNIVRDRREAFGAVVDAGADLVSGARHADRVDEDRARVRSGYGIPTSVIDALRGRGVHAEPWDYAAVWANDLPWQPLPVFQSYSAYTSRLDELNADALRSPDGPEAVLLNRTSIDDRLPAWESPAAQLVLYCQFSVAAEEAFWYALQRRADVCGDPQPLGEVRGAGGRPIPVPQASAPDAVVTARFTIHGGLTDRLRSIVGRPEIVTVSTQTGDRIRFVTGTAAAAHIVSAPATVGGRPTSTGEIDITELTFLGIGARRVDVQFLEIPLR